MKPIALLLVFVVAASGGCERQRGAPPSPRPYAPAPLAVPPPAVPPPAAPLPAAAGLGETSDDQDLRAEERDSNPRSETVKLKMVVTPAARGTVHWGRKKLADLQPGRMSVETERPRDTGPLDVIIRADGFLPHHVRLFTDRDDKLSIHLVRPDQAPSLLGYRRTATPAPAP